MDFTPHGIRFVKLGCPQNEKDLLKFFGLIFLLQKPAFRTNCILQMRILFCTMAICILFCTMAILEPNVEQEICVVSSFNFQQIKHNHRLQIKRYCNLAQIYRISVCIPHSETQLPLKSIINSTE